MCYYPGNKKKIGDEIARIIYEKSLDIAEDEGFVIKGYAEPFVGMCGTYKNMKNKIVFKAGDRNPYLIKLLKGLQNGFNPPTKTTEDEYYMYKETDNKTLKSIWLGFACGFRGIFRSSYNPLFNLKLLSEQSKEVGKKIRNVDLICGDYTQFSNLKNYIIYCVPPYKGTQNGYAIGNRKNNFFDYDKFILWCKKMSHNNIIFISEYTKPCKEAVLIWKKGKEKLYVI